MAVTRQLARQLNDPRGVLPAEGCPAGSVLVNGVCALTCGTPGNTQIDYYGPADLNSEDGLCSTSRDCYSCNALCELDGGPEGRAPLFYDNVPGTPLPDHSIYGGCTSAADCPEGASCNYLFLPHVCSPLVTTESTLCTD